LVFLVFIAGKILLWSPSRTRGLWQPLAGSIRITDRRIFFLPQRPFFTNGSLREQVCYPQEVLPGAPDAAQHARILAMFTMTGMTGQIRSS
jgi:ATP-binding cassette subfamily D (ALD) protein 4